MSNSKLVNFILHILYNTKDYIEYINFVFKVFERLKNNGEESYLDNFIILIIAD